MRLTRSELTKLAQDFWGNTGNPLDVDIAVAVAMAESGGVVDAVNDNYPEHQPDPESIYRYDYGLWQVNSVHGFSSYYLVRYPEYNAACAKDVWDRQGWRAWSTYTSGIYKKFLED